MSDTQKAQKKNLVKNLKMTKSKIDFWSFFVSKLSNYAIFVLRVQNGWFEVRLKAEELYYTTVETLYGKKRVYRVCVTKGAWQFIQFTLVFIYYPNWMRSIFVLVKSQFINFVLKKENFIFFIIVTICGGI